MHDRRFLVELIDRLSKGSEEEALRSGLDFLRVHLGAEGASFLDWYASRRLMGPASIKDGFTPEILAELYKKVPVNFPADERHIWVDVPGSSGHLFTGRVLVVPLSINGNRLGLTAFTGLKGLSAETERELADALWIVSLWMSVRLSARQGLAAPEVYGILEGAKANATRSVKEDRAGRPRPRRVLVVDDEEMIRELLSCALQMHGCEVDTASEGGEGLDMIRGKDYDLVIADFKMPGMDGHDFYQRVKDDMPDMAGRFVFATGNTVDEWSMSLLEGTGQPCLEKPFTLDKIRGLLTGGEATGGDVAEGA